MLVRVKSCLYLQCEKRTLQLIVEMSANDLLTFCSGRKHNVQHQNIYQEKSYGYTVVSSLGYMCVCVLI